MATFLVGVLQAVACLLVAGTVMAIIGTRFQKAVANGDLYEPRDPTRHVAPEVDEDFERLGPTIEALGFTAVGDFVETCQRRLGTSIGFRRSFVDQAGRERAWIEVTTTILGENTIIRPATLWFSSRLRSGELLITTNKSMLFPFQGVNAEHTTSVPSMRTAGEVLAVHRGRVARSLEPVARREIPADWVAEYHTQKRAGLEAALTAGVLQKVGEGDYRLTWRAALRHTLTSFDILRPVFSFAIRRNERKMLDALRVATRLNR